MEAQGHHAEHVFDFGGDGTTDSEIWKRALDKAEVIVSKDEDFVSRAVGKDETPIIVWVRSGNTRRQALLNLFGNLLPDIIAAIDRGERVIEIS